MLVLGIETTCDETAAGLVRSNYEGPGKILANEVMSQIAQHAAYGGVVPEIAARGHVDFLDRIIRRAMVHASVKLNAIDAIAAAAGPGLIGGVQVGMATAKAMALALRKPFIAVNHLEAHALTARLVEPLEFPYLALLVSGGHTQIVAVRGVGHYDRIGSTLDDAIGEAFDKIAKFLGLGYPGGPEIERQARRGDPHRFELPRPMQGRAEANFSFSGLKTATRLAAEKIAPLSSRDICDLCASFQAAAIDVIVERTRVGLKIFRQNCGAPVAVVVAGGVAANGSVRLALQRFCVEAGLPLILPPVALCGDNGAMIAWAGLERLRLGMIDDLDFPAHPRWPLDLSAETMHHGKA